MRQHKYLHTLENGVTNPSEWYTQIEHAEVMNARTQMWWYMWNVEAYTYRDINVIPLK